MNSTIRFRLSVMMFLQYVIWASWYVTMGRYIGGTLGFSPQQIGFAYNSTALAALISPFFVGMVADRFFATQKVLAAMHLLGAAFLFGVSQAKTFEVFYPLLIAHTLCYMPTLALTNSISFHQMQDPGKEFPRIRVLGTISWIVTVWAIGRLNPLDVTTPIPFYVGAGASVLMALYCLSLPNTPPKSKGERVTMRDVLGLDALALLKERSFLVFVIAAFLISIPLSFYFSFAPPFLGDMDVPDPTGVTVYGQISEIFFMLIMPFFFARLGVKWMLIVGMLSWAVRYLLFLMGYNAGTLWPLYLGIILHGVCYDFFFVTAYIYVDKKAPLEIRAKAQGFIALVTLGAGMFVGANLSGIITQAYTFPSVEPAKFQAVKDPGTWAAGQFAKWEANGQNQYGRIEKIIPAGPEVPEQAKAQMGAASLTVYERGEKGFTPGSKTIEMPLKALSKPLPRWDSIWKIPAIGALVIMVLFGLFFRYREEAGEDSKLKAETR